MNPTAKRIQDLLNGKNMTRADLARESGVPYHQITPWFTRPNAKPNAAALDAVAKALGVSTAYLLKGNDAADMREKIVLLFDQLSETGQLDLERYAEFLLSRDGQRDPQ